MSFVLLTVAMAIGMIIGNMFSGGSVFMLVADIVCEVYSHLTTWVVTAVVLLSYIGYHVQQLQHPIFSVVF